jgi:DnaJ-class molecular chaperone
MGGLVTAATSFASTVESDLVGRDLYRMANMHPAASKAHRVFALGRENAHPANSEDRLDHISRAFEVIDSPGGRALYDLAGTDYLNQTAFEVAGFRSDEVIQALRKYVDPLPPEISEFGGMISFPVQFDLVDFLLGAKREVVSMRYVKSRSRTRRFEKSTVTFALSLPPGAAEFHRIVAKGLGDSPFGRGASDVVFVAWCKPSRFGRVGADVIVSENVTFWEAAGRVAKELVSFDGTLVRLPGGLQAGQRVVFPGLGLPEVWDPAVRGKLIVKIGSILPPELREL